MYNFQQVSHGPEQDVERETVAYNKLLAKYHALQLAADEGVFQVTVHTDSGPISVPVSFLSGRNIAALLAEDFAEWVAHIEKTLNYSLEAVADELRADRKEKDTRHEQQKQAAYAAQTQQLAHQAATPAPRQAGPGRPKKVKVQPELVGELATGAAGVPMNHGDTGHAAARATSLPQG